jgi:hypothetical protein
MDAAVTQAMSQRSDIIQALPYRPDITQIHTSYYHFHRNKMLFCLQIQTRYYYSHRAASNQSFCYKLNISQAITWRPVTALKIPQRPATTQTTPQRWNITQGL